MVLTVSQRLTGLVKMGSELVLRSRIHSLVSLLRQETMTDLANVHPQGLVHVQLRRHRRQGVKHAKRLGGDAETLEVDDDALAHAQNFPRIFRAVRLQIQNKLDFINLANIR